MIYSPSDCFADMLMRSLYHNGLLQCLRQGAMAKALGCPPQLPQNPWFQRYEVLQCVRGHSDKGQQAS